MNNCFECGNPYDHKHHVVPKSKGGTKTIPLCRFCHSKIHEHGITTSELTKEALRRKAEKNEHTGGTIPFGYNLVDGVQLVPNENEIEVIKHMHQMRQAGKSLRQIASELKEQGIKTKTGKTNWNAKVVKSILDRQANEILMNLDLSNE